MTVQGDKEWWKKSGYCEYASRLLEKLSWLNEAHLERDRIDISEVQRAIYYAKKYHGNQKRKSGEPYYSHPIEVAYMVSDYLFRTDIIVTSVLHDTIEDTKLTFERIRQLFGEIVACQVMDLTRTTSGDSHEKISSAETVKRLFVQKKYDLLLIKQFDRLHNMRTIGAKHSDSITRIVEETIGHFTALAAFLGIRIVEEELIRTCTNSVSGKNSKGQCENQPSRRDAHLLSLIFRNDGAHK
ncbi:MAG: HD domain-containing protein [Amoebophilaceae bacterium]|jgi:(p)ppGpp synthase/HD superfamily hydrolase|nr:HD domain-containing protein [Amoebophilaceae bacterium]